MTPEASESYALRSFNQDIYLIDAPNWAGVANRDHLALGLTKTSISAAAERGLSHYLGQLYGVVGPGLIRARHVFKGLKREMLVEGDGAAAASKFAATWTPARDARLVGPEHNCRLEWRKAPDDRVFVVYISPNRMLNDFPSIYGWIEHWAWLGADSSRVGAPVEWDTRYDALVWSAS